MAEQRRVQIVLDVVPGNMGRAKASLDDLGRSAIRAGGRPGAPAGGFDPAVVLRGLGGRGGNLGSLLGTAGVAGAAGGGRGLGAALSGLGAGGVAAGAIGAGLAIEVAAIKAAVEALTRFAAKAQPATLQRFTLALDDLQAVIGHAFVPVIEMATKGVRLLGDVFATLLPSQAEMRKAMQALQPVFDELRKTMNELSPLLRHIALTNLVALTAALRALAVSIHLVMEAAKRTPLGILAQQLAQRLPGPRQLASSVGAAARPAEFLQLEDVSRQAALAAMNQGVDPQQQTAKNTADAVAKLDAILNALKHVPGPVGTAAAVAAAIQGWRP